MPTLFCSQFIHYAGYASWDGYVRSMSAAEYHQSYQSQKVCTPDQHPIFIYYIDPLGISIDDNAQISPYRVYYAGQLLQGIVPFLLEFSSLVGIYVSTKRYRLDPKSVKDKGQNLASRAVGVIYHYFKVSVLYGFDIDMSYKAVCVYDYALI